MVNCAGWPTTVKSTITMKSPFYELTSMTIRPNGLPSAVMSINTFGFDIAVLANRQNVKRSLARVSFVREGQK